MTIRTQADMIGPMDTRKNQPDAAAPTSRGCSRQALGVAGENAALVFLQGKGFRLLERNWRPQGLAARLELDLVGELKNLLLFVEVKSRTCVAGAVDAPTGQGYFPDKREPRSAFTPAKRMHLVQAARHFLTERRLWSKSCRFDLICVNFYPDGSHYLEHHEHVIELDTPVGGCNAAWQPW